MPRVKKIRTPLQMICGRHGYKIIRTRKETIFVNIKVESVFEQRHHTLFICNIPSAISEEGLLDIFTRIKGLYKFRLCHYEDGQPKGYAFAHYTRAECVRAAVYHLNGLEMYGQCLRVVQTTKVIFGNVSDDRLPYLHNLHKFFQLYSRHETPYYSCLTTVYLPGGRTEYHLEFPKFKNSAAARHHLMHNRVQWFGLNSYIRWFDQDWRHWV